MHEGTIYIQQVDDELSAIGIWLPPSEAEIQAARSYFTFADHHYRIHALIVKGDATVDQCRALARNFVEGKGRKINFSDRPDIFGIRTLRRYAFS